MREALAVPFVGFFATGSEPLKGMMGATSIVPSAKRYWSGLSAPAAASDGQVRSRRCTTGVPSSLARLGENADVF